MTGPFERFVGVDWSGAARASGQHVYVAETHRQGGRVTLHSVVRAEDRRAVEDFLRGGELRPAPAWEEWPAPSRLDGRSRRLVGLDFAFGFPAAFQLPQLDGGWSSDDLWRWAAALADEEAESVRSRLAEDPRLARQFRFRGGDGARMHRRRTDEGVEQSRPESVFHLIGPSQVGLASITGIAMLHRLRDADHLAVWPFDPPARLEAARVVLVEVFPRMWLNRGLRKNELPERVRQLDAWRHAGMAFHPKAELAAASSGDALDAAAAAVGLARTSYTLPSPEVVPAESRSREGWIAGVQVPG